jgi:hypothetical protein
MNLNIKPQNDDTLAAAISMKIINNITHYLRCGLRGASG